MSKSKSKSAVEVAPIECLLVTARHAARLLSISERSVYNLIERGDLKPIKIGGSTRFDLDDLRAFARKGSPAAESVAAAR